MPKHDFLEFDLNNLPDPQEMELANGTFRLTLQWNELGQFFTIDIESLDDDTHKITGEPVTFGVPLWYWAAYDWLPPERLVPMDEAGLESTVTWGNFQKTVWIMDADSVWEGGEGNGS